MKEKKVQLITSCIILCVLIICLTLGWLVTNTYNIHFSMDNNTLEAVKSINYSALINNDEGCCYPIECSQSIDNPKDCDCTYMVQCKQSSPSLESGK